VASRGTWGWRDLDKFDWNHTPSALKIPLSSSFTAPYCSKCRTTIFSKCSEVQKLFRWKTLGPLRPLGFVHHCHMVVTPLVLHNMSSMLTAHTSHWNTISLGCWAYFLPVHWVTLTFVERNRWLFSLSGFANLSTKLINQREFRLSLFFCWAKTIGDSAQRKLNSHLAWLNENALSEND